MSAPIVLSNLCWSTPDHRPLFTDLNLRFGSERSGLVGSNGTGKTVLLHLITGALQPLSGTVQVSGTLGWMRQDIQTHSGETIADLFGVGAALNLIERAESGLSDTGELAEIDWTLPARMEAALSSYDLEIAPFTPLAHLSGGQRTRAGLAALFFSEPDFLLLDEPTNNLDRAGRQMVIDFIRGWKGGALIASHDRELLHEMDAIVEINTLGATRYGGNYSLYYTRKTEQLEAAKSDLAHSQKVRAETERRAQQVAERKARKDSVGHKSRAKGGQSKITLDAAKGRSETTGGVIARQRDEQRDDAHRAVLAAREKLEVLQPLRMEIRSPDLPLGRLVLRLDAVTGGYDPARPLIRNFSLSISGPERIAITGPNGSGKTTLLSLITGQLDPQEGKVELHVPFALLDQHVGLLDPDLSLRDNFKRLDPPADENQCRAVLARFRFRADDALQKIGGLSGGQKLRAGLACTLGRSEPPAFLILDEPTNHLDLDSVETLERALASYNGALLMVSHDETFLEKLALDRRVDLIEASAS